MAKKQKEFEFDLDDVLDTIESFNANHEDEAYEIEEGEPDLMFQYFVEIMMKASEDEEILDELTNKDAAVKLYNSIPDEHPVFEAISSALKDEDETLPEDEEDKDAADDDEGDGEAVEPDEEEAAPEPKKEKKSKVKEEKPKKEKKPVETEDDDDDDADFKPECPEFGSFNDSSDECSTCADDFPEEYRKCRKMSSKVKEKPAKKEKAVKEESKEEKPKNVKEEK